MHRVGVAVALFGLIFVGAPTFSQVAHLDAYTHTTLAELSWDVTVAVVTTDVVGASAAYLLGVPFVLLAASHKLVKRGTSVAYASYRIAQACLCASWISVVCLGVRGTVVDERLIGDASPIYEAVSADLFLMTAAGLVLVDCDRSMLALLAAGPTSVVLRRCAESPSTPSVLGISVAIAASLACFVPPLHASIEEEGTVFPSAAERHTASATAQLVYVVLSFFVLLPLCASPWSRRGAAIALAQIFASNFSVFLALILLL